MLLGGDAAPTYASYDGTDRGAPAFLTHLIADNKALSQSLSFRCRSFPQGG